MSHQDTQNMIRTVKEFVGITGIKENTIRAAIKRKTIYAVKSKIDDEHPDTVMWVLKHDPHFYNDRIAKGWELPVSEKELKKSIELNSTKRARRVFANKEIPKEAPKIDKRKTPVSAPEFKQTSSAGIPIEEMTETQLKEEKLRREIAYKDQQTKLAILKEKKEAGVLIPIDTAIKILTVFIPAYKNKIKVEVESVVNTVCDEYNIKGAKRSSYLDDLQASIESAAEYTQGGVIESLQKLDDENNTTNTKAS